MGVQWRNKNWGLLRGGVCHLTSEDIKNKEVTGWWWCVCVGGGGMMRGVCGGWGGVQ